MNTLKQKAVLQRMTIMILLLLSVAIMVSAEGAFAQEKLPSDIYTEIGGRPKPFPSSFTVTYDGDEDLNNRLQLYDAITNSGKSISYTSTDTNVAMIDSKGYITAKQPGTTTIQMHARETDHYLEANASVELTIEKNARFIEGKSSYMKAVGNSSFKLDIEADKNGEIQYESSNGSVATVSQSGKVTIKGTGSAVITATAVGSTWYTENYLKTEVLVRPGKAVLRGIVSSKEKTLKTSWRKMKGVSGYQAICATNSGFTSGKKVKTVSSKASSVAFTGLSKGTKYYVKVRGYKTIQGIKYYGAYSKAKTVTVKGTPFYKIYEGRVYGIEAESDEAMFVRFGKISKNKIKYQIRHYQFGNEASPTSKTYTGTIKNGRIKFKVKNLYWTAPWWGIHTPQADRMQFEGSIILVNSKKIQVKIDSASGVSKYFKLLQPNTISTLTHMSKKYW